MENEKFKGFYMYFEGKDYFFISNRQRITKSVLAAIWAQLYGIRPFNADAEEWLRYQLRKATCEVKHSNNPMLGDYYDISGENFGGCGSRVDDGNTLIFQLLSV